VPVRGRKLECQQLAHDPRCLRIAIDAVVVVCKRLQRCQKLRYLHSGVQQLNKISGSDALTLGDVQQFNDSAFHKLRLRLCGLSNIIHGIL
jgi:hypothetical protein